MISLLIEDCSGDYVDFFMLSNRKKSSSFSNHPLFKIIGVRGKDSDGPYVS